MQKMKFSNTFNLFSTGLLTLLLLNNTQALADKNLPQIQQITLPALEEKLELNQDTSVQQAQQNWTQTRFTIGRNQTLSHALEAAHISPATVFHISRLEQGDLFTRLRVGETLVIWSDEQDQLQRIELKKSATLTHILSQTEDGYSIHSETKPIERSIRMVSGTINDSFYLAGEAAGLSPRTIMNLADIFAWEVDFVREMQPGNQFKIIYEQRFLDGEYIGDGEILAAELYLGGNRQVKAFQLKVDGEHIGYFNEKGQNLRKAFMRNPINYTRISSHFQRGRYHPVLQEIRDHKGVDYAAPTGTPIYAAGDGIIVSRGRLGSYGKKIKIRHGERYETVYGHMSRYGRYHRGDHVKQGEVIGYVGMTGLATGPHLHYEFRINGVHHDPLTVEFPDADPVRAEHRDYFIQHAAVMNSQLMRIDPETTQLAANFE